MKDFVLDLLFPKFCLNCKREGSFLCEDCLFLIDIFEKQYEENIFCACNKEDRIVKKLLSSFESSKEIAKVLSGIMLCHLVKIKKINFEDYTLLANKIDKKEIKRIGFWPQQELVKELTKVLKTKENKKKIILVDIELTEDLIKRAQLLNCQIMAIAR